MTVEINGVVLTQNDVSRFWAKVAPADERGCMRWTGTCYSGYGAFRLRSRMLRAHRVSFVLRVGPIPDGMQLDHLCRVRSCVNPQHLEVVTSRENTLRGTGPSAIHAAKTHCIAGHPFDDNNTYWRPDGSRACRTCHRNRKRSRSAAVQASNRAK